MASLVIFSFNSGLLPYTSFASSQATCLHDMKKVASIEEDFSCFFDKFVTESEKWEYLHHRKFINFVIKSLCGEIYLSSMSVWNNIGLGKKKNMGILGVGYGIWRVILLINYIKYC